MIDEVVLGKEALSAGEVAGGEVNLGKPESISSVTCSMSANSIGGRQHTDRSKQGPCRLYRLQYRTGACAGHLASTLSTAFA